MAALNKQPVSINFGKGLDLKSDPYQLNISNFLALSNSVFTTTGRLTKRNGFANITDLPDSLETTLTTFSGNLVATGSNLYAFSQDTNQWYNKGIIQPVQLNTLPLIRVSTSQQSPDLAVAPSGLCCLAYVDNSVAYYQISDSSTGQQIIARTALPSTAANPRAFQLGNYFIVTFMATVSAAPHLQYVAIPINNPSSPSAAINIDSTVASLTTGYDGYVVNNTLYLAWSGSSTTVRLRSINAALVQSSAVTVSGSHTSTLMAVTADNYNPAAPIIWITFWDSTSHNMYAIAYNQSFTQILAPHALLTGVTSLVEVTSVASNGLLTVFYETNNAYGPTGATPDISAVQTDFISKVTCTQAGTVVGPSVILRGVGLGSKAFIAPSGTIYVMAAYGDINSDVSSPSPDQYTYFLIDSLGNIYERLAYSNGGGYAATQVLPSVSLQNGEYYLPYLYADFLTTVNKNTTAAGITTSSIYTQYGVNLATFSINSTNQYSNEIAGALHLTGGQLWEYDGVRPVEHGFHVWPDNVAVKTATGSGAITAQQYFYQFCYEWTDNAGMLHRSAPSIPITITTTTSSSTNTIYVPTLRLTYKVAPNPVRIVGYRWSAGQQVYYQFTSVTSPTLNDPTVDYVTITDTLADSSILGNAIIYTTGGVVEDVAAPASIASALFNNRLWLIDAEDRNLLWYSKQVIEATPVEMSDLLTLYVAPTAGAQGSTGPCTALSAMDDKLIIFKADAMYYINGIGPDNTGANSGYSDPVYITSSVGCSNPNSIVLMPNGIMFQSDKGIWLLGRDLSTNYIGAPVESYNVQTVQSATAIPGTNQVRFILESGTTLVYDYYFAQWSTFTNVNAISATLYQSFHTYLNAFGQVYQESPGTYLDGSTPVLMSLTTAWINIAGLQGYERFYSMNLLGTYYTPFFLDGTIAYDYNSSALEAIQIYPNDYAPNWGGEANWGSGKAWGGPGNVFSARMFPSKQKCESFQITLTEIYDNSYGQAAGQGLSLSGILLLCGVKKGTRTQSAARTFGGSGS